VPSVARFLALYLACSAIYAVAAEPPTTDIKVDQVGYLPSSTKIAFVASPSAPAEFTLRSSPGDAVVFRGKLSAPAADPDSGDRVQSADFSSVSKPGRYYLEVPGLGRSWNFAIAPDVYARTFYLAMRSYYGQRCGTAVDLGPEFPGYTHAACHLDGAYHASSGKSGPKTSGKGWHDAGDYGRYVVNSGIATGTLLWTWELFGDRIRNTKLNIPETGNGTPDILNEIHWNLDWMLSMQDADGGVWHKQTSERFCAFIMPEKDTLTSYVIGTGAAPFKSSCATADLAAVAAIAARVFHTFDPAYAKRCLQAALQAWKWLDRNPNVTFRNPPGVSTGDYGDGHCEDEHLWAAAEIWRTTHEAVYESYVVAHAPEFLKTIRPTGPQSWSEVAPLGLWTYVLGGAKTPTADSIRRASLEAADAIVSRSAANPYRISLTTADYVWGSNGVLGNYGMQLLVANAIQPNASYVNAAIEDLHYLLGRNTFSLSYVTRVGDNPFRHPHHRPSGADNNEEPWPGLLSGGPNHAKQDPEMQKLANLPPAKMYLDVQGSYASNEIAINWEAPLVLLLAGTRTPTSAR
jgi:endoglucanase